MCRKWLRAVHGIIYTSATPKLHFQENTGAVINYKNLQQLIEVVAENFVWLRVVLWERMSLYS
jgi:hypothetical protein